MIEIDENLAPLALAEAVRQRIAQALQIACPAEGRHKAFNYAAVIAELESAMKFCLELERVDEILAERNQLSTENTK